MNGFHDSFNDSSSFLQSIDFDFLDACVNMNLHAEPSTITASSVVHNSQGPSESSRGSSCPDSEEAVGKCGNVAGGVAVTQFIASKCDPTSREYETEGLNVTRKDQVTETKITAKSQTGERNGFLNILQVIDASDSVPVHRSGANVELTNCDSKAAHPDSGGTAVNAGKSLIGTPTLVANQRMSLFASKIRKTLAANARMDTPVRIRPPASILDESVFDDLKAEFESEQKQSSYPENTFYGLPLKVQQLLKEQRSISELYGMSMVGLCSFC